MKKSLRRLGKLILYDLNYGYRDCRLKWLGAFLVQVYFVNMAYQWCAGARGQMGVLGYLTWLFRGMPEYFAVETGRFEIPVPWLMLHACLLFLVGFYPAADLTRSGGQALVRTGKRRHWLLGKAVWVLCTVTTYYCLLTVVLIICALLTGGIACSGEAMKFLYGMEMEEIEGMEIILSWWIAPYLVSLTLCLAEMTLSLVLEPVLALFLMLGYLTASVFWTMPVLLGNYAMLLRRDFWQGHEDISFINCLAACGICIGAALTTGCLYIKKKDIFPTENI
ncbi:hypothetical protein IMSAGC003_01294 [Lachnospiraceae bacterium]|nr:hypothetical protein [Acetatifactor sp.]GFH94762.1 hypothetical protein IMSAGC003_01294 [Lachnospiraceae bacterium]GFI25021.1 hypothetical protein IMSAGC012_00127 [Lachnospiraceae bacterium]